jgi:hypothetical protein
MMDYGAIARSRLAGAIRAKQLVQALVSAFPDEIAELELVFDQLRNERSIDTAVGVQLDRLGDIVGELRLGRSDDAYRRALRLRVFINISKGRPSDLIYAVKEGSQASVVQYFESYPAMSWLYTNGYDADKALQKTIQDVAPAGVFDVPVAVSFGEKPFRMVGLASDSANLGAWTTLSQKRMKTLSNKIILLREGVFQEYGLGGIQLGVLTLNTGARLSTLSGKRIRMKHNKRVIPSIEKLAGVYQA